MATRIVWPVFVTELSAPQIHESEPVSLHTPWAATETNQDITKWVATCREPAVSLWDQGTAAVAVAVPKSKLKLKFGNPPNVQSTNSPTNSTTSPTSTPGPSKKKINSLAARAGKSNQTHVYLHKRKSSMLASWSKEKHAQQHTSALGQHKRVSAPTPADQAPHQEQGSSSAPTPADQAPHQEQGSSSGGGGRSKGHSRAQADQPGCKGDDTAARNKREVASPSDDDSGSTSIAAPAADSSSSSSYKDLRSPVRRLSSNSQENTHSGSKSRQARAKTPEGRAWSHPLLTLACCVRDLLPC